MNLAFTLLLLTTIYFMISENYLKNFPLRTNTFFSFHHVQDKSISF